MGSDIFKHTIEILPDFLDSSLQGGEDFQIFFNKISEILTFDNAYIFFLNPDCVQLKYASLGQKTLNINDIIPMNSAAKDLFFTLSNKICDSSSNIVRVLGLSGKSFIISKLSIRGTIYGFLVLESNEFNFYGEDDLKILSSFASIISYLIKDVELSNVFKIQLKALKDGILETNTAYKTIKEQNIKILEADKVKNEFLANISHELRTPLNAIIGFSEVLNERLFGELNDKQSEYVNDIHVSGIHLLGMINEILDISKIEANAMTINKSKFLLSKVVDEVVNVIKPLALKKKITIKKDVSDGVVVADFQKLTQILYNLLSNAIKFSHDKSQVEISAYVGEDDFVIKVSDSGIGIEEKYHGKIFAKFVQLENSYTKKESSTGLGLTITKQLVEMQGGHISLISAVGQGTTFIVKLPNVLLNE